MKTKFDIGDTVLLKGTVRDISINNSGEICYTVIMSDADDPTNSWNKTFVYEDGIYSKLFDSANLE